MYNCNFKDAIISLGCYLHSHYSMLYIATGKPLVDLITYMLFYIYNAFILIIMEVLIFLSQLMLAALFANRLYFDVCYDRQNIGTINP